MHDNFIINCCRLFAIDYPEGKECVSLPATRVKIDCITSRM